MSSSRIPNLEHKALLAVLVLVVGRTPPSQAHAAWVLGLASSLSMSRVEATSQQQMFLADSQLHRRASPCLPSAGVGNVNCRGSGTEKGLEIK
jgi:hypothetical protein